MLQKYNNSNAHIRLLIIFTVIISVGYLLLFHHGYDWAHSDYAPQFNSILNGRGLKWVTGVYIDRYPPVIPYVFAGLLSIAHLFHVNADLLYVLYTMIIMIGIAIYQYRLATMIVGSTTAFLSAILLVSCPFIQFGMLHLAGEPTFILLTYMALCLLVKNYKQNNTRSSHYILIGVLLGIALLARPAGLPYPFLFALFILAAFRIPLGKRIILACIVLITTVLVIAPWTYTISKQEQYFVPLSTGAIPSIKDGFIFNNNHYREKLNLTPEVSQLSDELYTHYDDLKKDPVGFIKEQYLNHPKAFREIVWLKIKRAWYGMDSQNKKLELMNRFLVAIYLLLVIVGLIAYIRSDRYDKHLLFFFALMILSTWAMTVVVLSILRYMTPIFGLIMIFSAYGFVQVFSKFRAKTK